VTSTRPKAGPLGPGELPLHQWIHRPLERRRPLSAFLPEVHLWVGMDHISSGLTIQAWKPNATFNPDLDTLYAARWASPITSVEQALTIARDGAASAIAELFAVGYFE
jgi:hypothetical protein